MKRSMLAVLLTAGALVLPMAGAGAVPASVARAHQVSSVRHQILVKDGGGDVWRCGERGHCAEVGHVPDADVLRFRAIHGRVDVRFTLWFDDLQKGEDAEYYIPIKTPGPGRCDLYYGYVYTTRQHPQGYQSLLNCEGDDVSHRGMTHTIRYTKDTVTVVIPRARLENPRWVRVSAVDEVWPEGEAFDYEDNPMDHGHHDLAAPLSVRLYRSS